MGVLARASLEEIRVASEGIEIPTVEIVKPAEVGTLMIEARAGGAGRRFNAGEATMTRCVVRHGEILGFSYALGRDKAKAQLCAALDCLLQTEARRDSVLRSVIEPLARAQDERRLVASRRAAATKVEFFTMVRGDG